MVERGDFGGNRLGEAEGREGHAHAGHRRAMHPEDGHGHAADVLVELLAVLAGWEIQLRARVGERAWFPKILLAACVVFVIAANLAMATPNTWGYILAVVPPSCFFGAAGLIAATGLKLAPALLRHPLGLPASIGIELVKDKATRETFSAEESERLLRGFLSKALFDGGLYCRTDDRGEPVIQLAPPLICEQEHFDEMEQILRGALDHAWKQM